MIDSYFKPFFDRKNTNTFFIDFRAELNLGEGIFGNFKFKKTIFYQNLEDLLTLLGIIKILSLLFNEIIKDNFKFVTGRKSLFMTLISIIWQFTLFAMIAKPFVDSSKLTE